MRRAREDGASLVEFAMLMPFLLLLVLGIVELGFFLGEWNEIKHGAHQGARLAAVNDSNLLNNTCDAIGLHESGSVIIDFELTGPNDENQIGDVGMVTATATISSLSGLALVEVFLPSTISADAEFRLEQPATLWDDDTDGTC